MLVRKACRKHKRGRLPLLKVHPVLALFWLSVCAIVSVLNSFQVPLCAGWPRLLWFVTDGKHVVKPPKDWHPPIGDASNDIAYIEVSVVLWVISKTQICLDISLVVISNIIKTTDKQI